MANSALTVQISAHCFTCCRRTLVLVEIFAKVGGGVAALLDVGDEGSLLVAVHPEGRAAVAVVGKHVARRVQAIVEEVTMEVKQAAGQDKRELWYHHHLTPSPQAGLHRILGFS